MDYLKDKFADFQKALSVWKEALYAPFSDVTRDASIQRFEFTFELLWKTIKHYLKEIEGVECKSPKECFREIRVILEIHDADVELLMSMCDDRNLSVHTYSEKMANELYERLKKYWQVSNIIAQRMKERAAL